MVPKNREAVLNVCRNNIEAFVNIFMEKAAYAKTPPFHGEIYGHLQDMSLKRLAIVAPRGHSKSTVVSIAYPLWRICYNPPSGKDYFLVLISESQAQSINFLTAIKMNLMKNRLLRSYFGNLVGEEKWSEDEFVTRNNCRVVAKGTGQKIRGLLMAREEITRPNDIICDDFESETNSDTIDKIEKNIRWMTKAVEPSLADDGRFITIGTIVHEAAYLNRVRKDPAFKVLFYQAVVDSPENDLSKGKPLWPERFSMEKLMNLKASFESKGQHDAFWQEYMNVPINLEDPTFNKDFFQHFDHEFVIINHQPCLRLENTIIPINVGVGVDLAISVDKKADWTVISALGTDDNDNKYLLHYERFKTKSIHIILDKLFEVAVKYGATAINVETVQFQQVVATEFRRQMLERGLAFGVVETNPRTSKDSRIQSLQALFSGKRFYHRSWMMAFESELYSFPNAANDDILDSVYLANMVSHKPDVMAYQLSKKNNSYPRELIEGKSWMAL